MTHRIVSLIASATEIVAALGYEHCLAGRSHECDYPPSVLRLPVCSEARIDVNGSSGQIDREVRLAVRQALSIYRVFTDQLEQLQPTLILTQTQCDVCAVSLKDVQAAVCDHVGSHPQVVALESMSLSDVWDDISRVAEALNDQQAGRQLIESLQQRLQTIAAAHNSAETQPTVACIEWLQPLMCAGNWVPQLVNIAGGQAVLCESGKHSPYITWQDLRQADPDFIVLMPCGFGLQRTAAELDLLTNHPDWSKLKAVQTGQVFLSDGNHYFNRPGPRVVDSAEILSEILWPELGNQRFRPHAWQKLSDLPQIRPASA